MNFKVAFFALYKLTSDVRIDLVLRALKFILVLHLPFHRLHRGIHDILNA